MKYFVVIAIGLGAVLLYLLATASRNSAFFADQYPLLLALNGALAALLLLVVGVQLWRMVGKLRRGVFGSRLAFKLLVLFALMALVPGALVYVVSVQFLTKSIESWFDVRVERALEGGLNLGRTALDNMLKDMNAQAVNLSLSLAEQPGREPLELLNQLREQTGVFEVSLFDQRGKLLAFSTGASAALLPHFPDAAVLRQVRLQKAYSAVERLPDRGMVLRVLVPVNVLMPTEDVRVLQLIQPVPTQLKQDAEAVQAVYQDYQELLLARTGLKRLYRVTLTVSLLLSLLSALALAFILSERLAAPLGLLAEGTRAVAQGDFSRRHPVASRDEMGILMASFNAMTDQLAEARAVALRKQAEVESAKAYLESLLANLSSGVVAFDKDGRLRSANPSAAQILGVDADALVGLAPEAIAKSYPALAPLVETVAREFADSHEDRWQRQVERPLKSGAQVLLVRGTRLPEVAGSGCVVVFDDVTDLIQAQRDAAWGEVARRLAHEIKNPLTPIQLAAERLQHKLADRLAGRDAEVLARATRTIVAQVAAMKTMVDAFSRYARLPEIRRAPLDINRLVHEILPLYEAAVPAIRVDLAPHLPPVMGDAEQLGQVIHNLLRNAQEATGETTQAHITLMTRAEEEVVTLSVVDDGPGFPEEVVRRAFEPYVTTKLKGTGLGLAIVKRIVEAHEGKVRIENLAPRGARVTIELPALAAAQAETAVGQAASS
ncbi:sensor histidine kinase [Pelomicrobium methylotrophicum]|uniref:histidine kinase n=1 Tax=Pelomicrobium methylotrophicum TaxID=2602750 RepID=A0A5C7ENZ4_9PROT|nr:ATP-binding protein [Pelomicrobium methylotrophicum]TXF13278.1 HAMP domain-containing protein [Pelomicrobium methylotrophicum]